MSYLASDALEGRATGTKGDSLARLFISKTMKEIGLTPCAGTDNYMQYFSIAQGVNEDSTSSIQGYNVIGFLEGKDTNQTLVIGAHYDALGKTNYKNDTDSIYNGADDNASGVVIILELARLLSSQDNVPCNIIFVAFGAEELDLLGSKHFLEMVQSPGKKIKAMLNYDSVGRMIQETLYLDGTQTAVEWKAVIENTVSYGINLFMDMETLYNGGDHFPFYQQDIPVLFFFTGFHEDIHDVSDEITKINFHGIEKIIDFSRNLIDVITRSDQHFTFSKD